MAVDIKVPTLGESVTEATVSKWLKQQGDKVNEDDPVCELETDKVSVEVNAPATGTLASIEVAEGSEVAVGALLGRIEEGEGPAAKADGGDGEAKPAKTEPEAEPAKEEAPAAKPAASGGERVEVAAPSMGESVSTGTVGAWSKSEGDTVAADEVLVEIETDKVTVEVNAPAAGTLTDIQAREGDEIGPGGVLAYIDTSGAGAAAAPAAKDEKKAAPAAEKTAEGAPAKESPASAERPPLSPAVRKLVDDNDLDPAKIQGSGPDGRITKGDVQSAIESGSAKRTAAPASPPPAAQPAAAPQAATPKQLPPRPEDPREEVVKMTKLRQVIASRLKQAQNSAAMLTTWNEVDMQACMDLRNEYKDGFEKKHGVKLGFMSFFVRAACIALKEWPAVNGEIYGDQLIYKNYYNVGVAVGSPQGLVVPVLRDADQLGFSDIEGRIADFGRRARDGKLTIDEMSGGTFTISNGGVFGSLNSMPILNMPQSAILGMHKIQKRPVVIDDEIVARPMMYLALSYDHRIIDGREAVSFLVRLKECIEDPQRILLDV